MHRHRGEIVTSWGCRSARLPGVSGLATSALVRQLGAVCRKKALPPAILPLLSA